MLRLMFISKSVVDLLTKYLQCLSTDRLKELLNKSFHGQSNKTACLAVNMNLNQTAHPRRLNEVTGKTTKRNETLDLKEA